jgi:hypothetical protein
MVLIALPPDPLETPARADVTRELRHMLRAFPGSQ